LLHRMQDKKEESVSAQCTRALDALPDVFVATGVASAAPQLSIKSLDELVAKAKKSWVGKRALTVFDERVRKSLELEPGKGCDVVWPQLEEVLDEVSRGLVQGRPLRAEAYKVLVYQKGDFFAWHRDSKKGEGHLLTLCVDAGLDECIGGELRFRPNWDEDTAGMSEDENEDEECAVEPPNKKTAGSFEALSGVAYGSRRCQWSSQGKAGAYSCWFATQLHCVAPVTWGRRVVVQYNVFMDQNDRLAVPRIDLRPLAQSSNLFGRLGKDILQLACRRLSLQSLGRLLRTCKAVRACANPGTLVGFFLESRKATLLEELSNERVCRLGLVLSHLYSFDGGTSVPWGHVRGRDAWATAALAYAFGAEALRTEQCLIKAEVVTSDYEGESGASRPRGHFSVFRTVTEKVDGMEREWSERDNDVEVPESVRALVLPEGYTKVSSRVFSWLDDTETENDGQCLNYSWPFWFTRFLAGEATLARCERGDSVESEKNLWGNQATFDLFWYRDTAVIVRFAPDPPVPESRALDRGDTGRPRSRYSWQF
jgi:hypothetical protein